MMAIPDLTQLAHAPIRYREWLPPSPKAGLLLVHGLGAHSARWDFLGTFFHKHALVSWGIELPGFGDTPGPRGDIPSFQRYYAGLQTLQAAFQAKFPGLPMFILGESLGGLIAVRLLQTCPALFRGGILFSPAFANALPFTLLNYLTIFSSLFLNPLTQIQLPFSAAMCTRDQAYQQIMEQSPLELRTASARLLVLSLKEEILAQHKLPCLNSPVLFQVAGKDQLVQPRAEEKAFQRWGGTDKTILRYPRMLHALSIDLDREHVFQDALQWLNERL